MKPMLSKKYVGSSTPVCGSRTRSCLRCTRNSETGSDSKKKERSLLKIMRDACQVAQRRHYAARLQLRKEAGRESCMFAQFHQPHGFLQPQPLDALTDALLRDESLCGQHRLLHRCSW